MIANNPVVKFFSSLKLTLFTLFSIAATSIVGTIIPQNLPLSQYKAHFSLTIYHLLKFFGIFDMYHSWWFLALLILLIANLIFCSLKHYKTTYHRVFKENKILTKSVENTILNKRTLKISKRKFNLKRLEDFIKKELSHKYYKNENNGEIHFFINKHKFSDFGYYIVHLSLIIIAIGAIIGSIWGFKGFINIPEGETKDSIFLKSGNIHNLNFKIKCIDFTVDFYPNGAPKEYKSLVEIIDKNKKIRRVLKVNHPLTYKGITFYQASYGTVGQNTHIVIKDRVTGKVVFDGNVQRGIPVKTSDPKISFVLENYSNNFQGFGPTAQIVKLIDNKPVKSFYVFKKFPDFDLKNRSGKFVVYLKSATFRYYTGLQATKDPGVNVVWLGCFLMMMGLYISFFLNHKKYWIKVAFDGGKVDILFAGSMRKNRLNFETEFNQKFNKLKEVLEEK